MTQYDHKVSAIFVGDEFSTSEFSASCFSTSFPHSIFDEFPRFNVILTGQLETPLNILTTGFVERKLGSS